MSRYQQLSPHLYRFTDTCNVYVLVDQERALLIDCGAGDVLDHLDALGVRQVDWVLFTHHHRDQAQGAQRLVDAGARLAVPQHERYLFDDVENFWRNRRIFDQYNVRNTFFALTHSVPVAQELVDYTEFAWGPFRLAILPTPGHTLGSITLIGEIDGQRVAFTGDLIAAPGKVHTMYDMQMDYGALDLVDQAILSLRNLRRERPALVCPSHGEPIADPEPGLALLQERLREWFEFYSHGQKPAAYGQIVELTPHLIAIPYSCANFYCLLGEDGRTFFVDYGFASANFLMPNLLHPGERQRFIEHALDQIMSRYGVRTVEVAMPSHYHDDHINGFPYLQRRFGTRVWAYHNMVDLLERPRCKNVGCIYPDPIKVERAIGEGERVRWDQFELTVVHFPGHTEYQNAIFAEIDGRRVAFTGDNMFKDPNLPVLTHNVIYRNEHHVDSHEIAARKILDFEPELICPGHTGPYAVTREDLEQYLARAVKQKEIFQSLTTGPSPNYALNPNWATIYPYQVEAKAGEPVPIEFRLRNYHDHAITAEAVWVLPPGWTARPDRVALQVQPGETGIASAWLTAPAEAAGQRRVPIAIDVTRDGQRLGQIAEAVVDVA